MDMHDQVAVPAGGDTVLYVLLWYLDAPVSSVWFVIATQIVR